MTLEVALHCKSVMNGRITQIDVNEQWMPNVKEEGRLLGAGPQKQEMGKPDTGHFNYPQCFRFRLELRGLQLPVAGGTNCDDDDDDREEEWGDGVTVNGKKGTHHANAEEQSHPDALSSKDGK